MITPRSVLRVFETAVTTAFVRADHLFRWCLPDNGAALIAHGQRLNAIETARIAENVAWHRSLPTHIPMTVSEEIAMLIGPICRFIEYLLTPKLKQEFPGV